MRAEVNVNGVIYEVFLSVQTSSKLELNKTSKLLTTHIIREDANLLFGFLDSLEQKSFERLLKINGVGVKVAIAILSTYKSEEFAMLVNNKDLKDEDMFRIKEKMKDLEQSILKIIEG